MKDWPLVQSPVIGSIINLAYILFIYLGPKWMAHRPPFQMKPVIVTYNLFMVIYSGFVAYEVQVGDNIVRVSNSLDPGETPRYSGVSPGSKLFAFGTMIAIGRIRVKVS